MATAPKLSGPYRRQVYHVIQNASAALADHFRPPGRGIPRPPPGRGFLQLDVRRLRSVEVAVQLAHRIARPVGLPFDPSGRRVKGADQASPRRGSLSMNNRN